jgi:hypothetical protein
MLPERLELLDHEIAKLHDELAGMYAHIAIKENASPAMESLYQTKKLMLADFLDEKKKILDIMNKQH